MRKFARYFIFNLILSAVTLSLSVLHTKLAFAATTSPSLTISNGQASNDATTATYTYQYTGSPQFFRVYIDTDVNSTTGYRIGGIGAEYLIENSWLYKYSGTGASWAWTRLSSISSFSSASGVARFTIARSAIGETATSGEASNLLYNVGDSSQNVFLPKFTQNFVGNILTPQISRVELVANDGLQPGSNPYVSNAWGGHMSRIVRTNDGTVFLLYLRMSSANLPEWNLIKRDPSTGQWTNVVSGDSSDEAHLLRNPVTDAVYVIAYPNGLPAIWSSPSFVQQNIPGSWQQLPNRSRHYGNAGIGSDGTICLKASHEFSSMTTFTQTAATNTDYECTTSTSNSITWGPFISHASGYRHAYDYIFPGIIAGGFYGSSQSDMYKDAAGYPMLPASTFPYVFNGVRGYSSLDASDSNWMQKDVFVPLTVVNAATATVAPMEKQIEAFVDSKKRAFSIAYTESTDGTSPLLNLGPSLAVTNPTTGASIYSGKLNLPTYGNSRLLEDAKGNLWVIWTNLGTRESQFVLYKLMETTTHGVTTFNLGQSYDLSGTFASFSPGWSYTPYAIYGQLYLATPRGGTLASNTIDGYFNTCATSFTVQNPASRSAYVSSQCFNADNSGQMPVVYIRIRLPD